MEVLRTEPYLSNPESNRSEFVGMFSELCLKSGWNLVGVGSLVPEKSHNYSLIIFHHKRTVNGFWLPEWKDTFFESDTVKSNLIDLVFRRLHTVEIYSHERQTPDLSAGGWGMHFPTRRYVN
jgi:hypothetical protein